MIKPLEQIEKEFEQSSEQNMSDFIYDQIRKRLEINPSEIYYLLCRAGEKDADISSILEYCYIKNTCTLMSMNGEIQDGKYSILVNKINEIQNQIGLKKKVYALSYPFPFDPSAKTLLEVHQDDIIIALTTINTTEFSADKYYCDEIDEYNTEDKTNKLNLPYKSIINTICDELESLGFVDINNYVGYDKYVAYIYPNAKGKKIIDYIQKLK